MIHELIKTFRIFLYTWPKFSIPKNQSTHEHLVQIDISYLHLSTQSDPDSQTDPHQVHNTWRSCNAVLPRGRHTGSVTGMAGKRYPLLWFRSLVCPNRNNPQTTINCRPYRLSHVGCRYAHSGSSGFGISFLLLRLPTADLHKRFIAVQVGVSAVRVNFLQ